MSQGPPEKFDKRIITGGSDRGEARLPSGQSVNDFHGRSDVDSSLFAQHHTLGTSRTQASPGDHTHDGTSSKLTASGKRTAADQTKWGTQSVQEDVTGLFFDLEPNTYYAFKAQIFAQASAGSLTFQFAFTLPASATIQSTSNSTTTAATSGSIFRERTTSAAPTTPALPIGTTDQFLGPQGTIFSGVGGRMQLRMQKLVATAGTLTVFANSSLEVNRIGTA